MSSSPATKSPYVGNTQTAHSRCRGPRVPTLNRGATARNHYGRKMLGYLHATGNGAWKSWTPTTTTSPTPDMPLPDSGTFATTRPDLDFVNIYRGYLLANLATADPLDQIQVDDNSYYFRNLEPVQSIGFGRDSRIWTPM